MLELPHVRDMNTGQHQAHAELLSKQKLELNKQLILQESISIAAHIVILHLALINASEEIQKAPLFADASAPISSQEIFLKNPRGLPLIVYTRSDTLRNLLPKSRSMFVACGSQHKMLLAS